MHTSEHSEFHLLLQVWTLAHIGKSSIEVGADNKNNSPIFISFYASERLLQSSCEGSIFHGISFAAYNVQHLIYYILS